MIGKDEQFVCRNRFRGENAWENSEKRKKDRRDLRKKRTPRPVRCFRDATDLFLLKRPLLRQREKRAVTGT
ncbi:hypothetical protein LptCag_0843 [Leptospirillum ferriphilum]|uniref:Uncharacterized protein n=1 Tax=Leptospirillum ferriphilum TaxID=178606 RepID=A0A094W6A3_9BACT|nr:hypothetical protein LptCag_0843 [Leptospirillum ferriphilum]